MRFADASSTPNDTGTKKKKTHDWARMNSKASLVQKILGWPSLIDPDIRAPPAENYHDDKSVHQPQHGLPIINWKKKTCLIGVKNLFRQFIWLSTAKAADGEGTTCAFYKNPSLNRYTNIQLYDCTRVVLKDGLGTDYIHASYVDGYKQKSAYILTQGPTKNTIADLWRMVWQEKVVNIVMLTGFFEKHKSKCAMYFPTTNRKNMNLGAFFISLVDMEVQNGNLLALVKIPGNTKDLISFVYMIKDARASMVRRILPNWGGHPKGPPMIVHCSAGIGRSATFAILDICLDMLLHVQRVNVAEVTRKVRAQRAGAVQTPWQYLFLHYAILVHAKDLGYIPSKEKTNHHAN
ncbi:Y phosphatase domain containing protein [Trichuris trichiura]|uniref:Y phosphatase domain containing protein n=1 Tax=Trichuris trichiura TaxID=36087 RepID=A0A077YZQ2_TRITR|nr:Y phosphatase domain containing protein [Trichuris trichiura]